MDKTSPSSSFQNHHITFDPILKEKVAVSEALCVFEVAQDDLSLRACNGIISSVFQKMFSDSNVEKLLTMSRQKASHVLQDVLGPLLSQWLATKLSRPLYSII